MGISQPHMGDNCYYMGFLFTLASLAATLMAISWQRPDQRGMLLEGVVGDFGTAVISSIVGFFLRAWFLAGGSG